MKKMYTAIAALAILSISSCNDGGEKTESPVADTLKPVETTTAKVPEFKPFDVVEITHTVKDYATWKTAFDNDSVARKASGLEFMVIGREEKNPNDLMVVLNASDVNKAKEFASNPRLKEVMDKNGVISKPVINYFHVIRFNPDSKEKQWVTITHKVKDFAAWEKVFDAEGTATRSSFGLVDVALARGIDDPNLVHIVFDINDMTKAKARMTDTVFKQLMTDAGVEGAPIIQFYKTAE